MTNYLSDDELHSTGDTRWYTACPHERPQNPGSLAGQGKWAGETLGVAALLHLRNAGESEKRKAPTAGKHLGASLTAPSDATGGRASTMIVHRPTDRINAPRRAAH